MVRGNAAVRDHWSYLHAYLKWPHKRDNTPGTGQKRTYVGLNVRIKKNVIIPKVISAGDKTARSRLQSKKMEGQFGKCQSLNNIYERNGRVKENYGIEKKREKFHLESV